MPYLAYIIGFNHKIQAGSGPYKKVYFYLLNLVLKNNKVNGMSFEAQ